MKEIISFRVIHKTTGEVRHIEFDNSDYHFGFYFEHDGHINPDEWEWYVMFNDDIAFIKYEQFENLYINKHPLLN